MPDDDALEPSHYEGEVSRYDNVTGKADAPSARYVTGVGHAPSRAKPLAAPRSGRDPSDQYRVGNSLAAPAVTEAEIALIQDLLFAAMADMNAED